MSQTLCCWTRSCLIVTSYPYDKLLCLIYYFILDFYIPDPQREWKALVRFWYYGYELGGSRILCYLYLGENNLFLQLFQNLTREKPSGLVKCIGVKLLIRWLFECVYTYAHVCKVVCTLKDREGPWVSCIATRCHIPFKQGLLLNLKLTISVRPANFWDSPMCPCLLRLQMWAVMPNYHNILLKPLEYL